MSTMTFFIVMVILFFIFAALFGIYLGRKYGSGQKFMESHPAFVKWFLWGYVVFAGCFTFPIRSEPFPLDFMKLYLLVVSYGVIGLGMAGIYGGRREKMLYLPMLGLTMLGMACRYLVEYGEVSNTYNFTPVNVASYLIIMPAYTMIAYHLIVRALEKKE